MATNPAGSAPAAPSAAVVPPTLPPHPDLTRPPTGAPGGPEIPPTIPLTLEEYHRLRGLEKQIADFQASQQAAIDAKEQERVRALAEKGEIEKALELQRQQLEGKLGEATTRYTQLEQQVFSESKNAVIAQAFANRVFVGATPEQQSATASMVRRLLQDDFEATRDATGAVQVLERASRRPAAQVITEKLNSSEFAIFFTPTHRGGSGSDASRAPATSQQPGSYFEQVVTDFKTRQATQGIPAFGLRPVTRK